MTSNKSGVLLSSGYFMPLVGLGTWTSTSQEEIDEAIVAAIDAGYRHIDTAYVYENEKLLGQALKNVIESGKVQRSDLFIVSKLPPFGMREENVESFFMKSLTALQLDYLDLYLVHTPVATKLPAADNSGRMGETGVLNGDHDVDLNKTWEGMEALVDKGLVRSIGLSNFNSKQIQQIVDNARIKPSNLQVECHAYLPQNELHEFCKSLNISFTAYSPLGSPGMLPFMQEKYKIEMDPEKFPRLLSDPKVVGIAEKHKKTAAQVLLRHLIDKGMIVIPKSTNPQRIKENIDLFDFNLPEEDTAELKSMGNGFRYFLMEQIKGYAEHPAYPFSEPF